MDTNFDELSTRKEIIDRKAEAAESLATSCNQTKSE